MTEVSVVGLDQVQKLVLIETELDALSVGNMITSLKAVQLHSSKGTRTNTTNV